MSPSRGTAAKSDAVLSERLTGQGEDARPAFGRREPACRGCAGSPGRAQEDNVEGGEGFHAGGEAPDSSARRAARAALQAQTCSSLPPAPSSAGPGPGRRPLCQRQSHTLHALSPLGPRGPCVLPPSLCLRGTRRWGGDQRGPRGRRAVRESRVRWPGHQGILVPPRSPEGVGRDARFPRTRGTRFRTRRPSRRPWGSERHRRFSAACRFPGLRSPPSPCGPRANTLTLPRAIFTPDPK